MTFPYNYPSINTLVESYTDLSSTLAQHPDSPLHQYKRKCIDGLNYSIILLRAQLQRNFIRIWKRRTFIVCDELRPYHYCTSRRDQIISDIHCMKRAIRYFNQPVRFIGKDFRFSTLKRDQQSHYLYQKRCILSEADWIHWVNGLFFHDDRQSPPFDAFDHPIVHALDG
jgi:hypothetical protein